MIRAGIGAGELGPPALLDRPWLCPRLIGREGEVEALVASLAEVAGGEGRTIVVSGEAGIGKSRLAAEVADRLAARGFEPLTGTCFEPDLLSALSLVRELVAAAPDRAETADSVRRLTRVITPVARFRGRGGELDRRALARLLLDVVAGSGEPAPRLLVLEDLHWADEASLELLGAVVEQGRGRSLAVLATHRTEESTLQLDRFLAGLERARRGMGLMLGPLDAAGIEALITATFDLAEPLRRDFVESVAAITDGNPFLIEETLRSMIAAGDIVHLPSGWTRRPLGEIRIPHSVREALRRRTASLDEDARRLLTLAAVAGRRFDAGFLASVSRMPGPRCIAAVRRLIAVSLVVEEPGGALAFRHALTRQAVYDELLELERGQLHLELLEALERLRPGEPSLDDRARHAFAARQWERALQLSTDAAERAAALRAPGAAAEHYTRALDAAARLGRGPRADLLLGRARAHETRGDFEAALADLDAALAVARSAGDLRQQAELLVDRGMIWYGRDFSAPGEDHATALRCAKAAGDRALAARALNGLGNWHMNQDRVEEALEAHRAALTAFEVLEDRRGIAETLDFLGMAEYFRGSRHRCGC